MVIEIAPKRVFKVADLFCGAGGSSTGARRAIRALGAEMDLVAVNHWPRAIETHQKNHPHAHHYVQDVNDADPERLVEDGYLDLLMASPECRFFSRARGGKPLKPQGRMSPWAINRWLTALDVRCLLVENVPEFVDWSPVIQRDGQIVPDPTKKGLYFQSWVKSLWEMGYAFEWRCLNAADFGDATTRVRFFGLGRKDGLPIVWPEPSHSRAGAVDLFGRLQRWRSAREIIDWAHPGRSLLTRERPLSLKTRMRIARGLQRFGGELAPLYIQLLDLPADEIAALVESERKMPRRKSGPFVLGQHGGGVARSVSEPVPTITADGYMNVVQPEATPFVLAQGSNGIAKNVDDDPVPTLTTVARIRLIEPMLSAYYGNGGSSSVDAPVPTVTTKDRHALIDPLVVPYGPKAEARPDDQPLPTIMTRDRLGVAEPTAEPFITQFNGPDKNGTPRAGRSIDEPVSTITAGGKQVGLVEPVVEPFVLNRHGDNGSVRAHAVDEPLPTATSRGAGYLVEPFIVPNFGEAVGQKPRVHEVDAPLPAVTGHGAGALVEPVIVETDQKVGVVEPVLSTAVDAAIDPKRLVLIDGVPHQLDIRFRMLTNRELARAMGFDDDEQRYEFTGNSTEITKQIGNAVPVNMARALVSAIVSVDSAPATGEEVA